MSTQISSGFGGSISGERNTAGHFVSALTAAIALLLPLLGLSQTPAPFAVRADLANSQPRIAWNSTPGLAYEVLSRESLASGHWEKVATIISDAATASWIDPNPAEASRFYRVLSRAGGRTTQVRIVHSSLASPALVQAFESAPYSLARPVIETFATLGQLIVPLPLEDLQPFPDIVIPGVEIYFDDEHRSLTFSGRTTILNQPVELLLTAYWGTEPGATPAFTLGIKLRDFSLEQLDPALAGSPLSGIDLKNTVLILAQTDYLLDPLKLPGRAYTFYDGASIQVERGVNFFRVVDLGAVLPIAKGLQLLGVPETKLALQGIVGVDPNMFFSAVQAAAPALLHLRSQLDTSPVPGLPDWVSTSERRLDLTLLAPGTQTPSGGAGLASLANTAGTGPSLFITLTDVLKVELGNQTLEFETVTDLNSLEQSSGTTTVVGTARTPWNQPFGIPWLALRDVTIELTYTDGKVTDANLSANFSAGEKAGTASIALIDAESGVAEISLSTDQLTVADLAAWAGHFGLTIPTADLPEILTLREPMISLRTGSQRTFTVTGKLKILGDLETELLVTMVERGGKIEPLIATQAGQFQLSRLIPSVTGTSLGDLKLPVSGFGSRPAQSSQTEEAVDSSELSPPARNFFARKYGSSDFTLSIPPGVQFDAELPLSGFPSANLQALGLSSTDRIAIAGPINVPLGAIVGGTLPALNDLRLEALLPLKPLPGLPAFLEPVTVLSRKIVLNYSAGQLEVSVENRVSAMLGGTARVFVFTTSLSKTPEGGALELAGTSTTPWEQPFNVPWLTVEQVQLRLALSSTATQATLAGRIAVGSKLADAAIDLIVVDGQPQARLRATLDQLTLTEFIAWAQDRLGVSPFGAEPPDGLLDLRQITLEIQTGPKPRLTVSASTTLLNNLPTRLLFTTVEVGGQTRPVLSFGLDDFSLGLLSPQLASTPAGNYKFPSSVFTVSSIPLSFPSSELSPEAAAFFQKIHGRPDFTFKAGAGLSFGATLPVSFLPSPAVAALGMNASDRLAFEGTIGITFGMLSGKAAVNVDRLDLLVALPNAKALLFPPTLPADPTVQRTLALSYRNLPGPENALAIRVTDRVAVNLDNARRTFVLTTALSSSGELAFEGRLDGNWVKPFGVEWLTLNEVVLSLQTDGTQSQGSLRSSFPLGTKTIGLGIELTGNTGDLAVKLTGSVDQLSIDDVIELVQRQINRPLFPGTPPADFATLDNVTMTIRLGRTKGFSIGATSTLAGRQAELLWSFETEAGQEPNIVLGMQPRDWSLSGAFPSLSNPLVDGLKLPTPTLVFARSNHRKEPHEVQEEEKQFYSRSYGTPDFAFNLPSGLNLVGSIPLGSLPADSPLRDLMNVLGMQGDNLRLEGSLGNALDLVTGGGGGGAAGALKDLSLRVGLPPMRPKESPEWFRSGQLALQVTGAPSVGVVGEVTVKVEDDILTFFIESGISFPGPTLQLVGGLKSGGSWNAPFGVEWLTLHELIVLLGVDATGSVKLGFSGDMIVGEKDIQVAALIAVSPVGVPTNLILEASSTEGLAMSDIVALQARMAAVTNPSAPRIPIDQLPEMALRNFALKFAPRPEPSLGVERGLALSGDFFMQTQQNGALQHIGGLSMKVGEGEISASGSLISSSVGPVTWQDPRVDLLLSLQQQRLFVGGLVSTDNLNADFDLGVTRERMSYDVEAKLFNQFHADLQGEAEFNFGNASFPINGDMLQDFVGATTASFKEAFAAVAAQGETAIAGAQSLFNQVQSLRISKESQLTSTIQGFVDELDLKRRTMEATKATRDAAKSAMDSALAARNSAWNLYDSTPAHQVALKAARYTDYLAKAAVYTTRQAAYTTANAAYLAAKAAYDIIPPIEQRPVVIALRAEINDLTQQLEARRQQLIAVTETFRTVIDAVKNNQLAIESASFGTTLRSLLESKQTTMSVTVVFAGQRRTFNATWNFSRTVRENLQPVIDVILREQRII